MMMKLTWVVVLSGILGAVASLFVVFTLGAPFWVGWLAAISVGITVGLVA